MLYSSLRLQNIMKTIKASHFNGLLFYLYTPFEVSVSLVPIGNKSYILHNKYYANGVCVCLAICWSAQKMHILPQKIHKTPPKNAHGLNTYKNITNNIKSFHYAHSSD